MSSCLSGGSRVYGLEIEIVKSPSSSTITSHLSSPSSTVSESSNSPLGISTRKPRTPRKRPNQTYNEAARLLSTANPRIFSPKHLLAKPCKFTTPHDGGLLCESVELLLPFRVFDNSGFLLHHPIQEKPSFQIEPSVVVYSSEKSCQSPVENDFPWDLDEDFDAESILDEEIEKGIDSIMGNPSAENNDSVDKANVERHSGQINTCYHGFPMGLGFGVRKGVRASRHVDEGEWWRFPTVDVLQISPKLGKSPPPTDKKKKKVEKAGEVVKIIPESTKENSITKQQKENSIPKSSHELLLKLNYDGIANAWSDRGSPFSQGTPGHEMSSSNNDLHARLAQIDLFSESGGVRDASVLRYKEKRRTRLFSKKIRYQVRKVNADRRPRMKGRFVRRPNSPMSEE